jgi:hypothetical protein
MDTQVVTDDRQAELEIRKRIIALEIRGERLQERIQHLTGAERKRGKPATTRYEVEEFIRHALLHNPPGIDAALKVFARYFTPKGKDESKEVWQARVAAQVSIWKAA